MLNHNYVTLFSLALTSLFPLINPIGIALIVQNEFATSGKNRVSDCFVTCTYSFVLGLLALIFGRSFFAFMGISVPSTQIAGGILLAIMGISLLNSNAKEKNHDVPQTHTMIDRLFYPIAFPLTMGPGSISALILLNAHAHADNMHAYLVNLSIIALALLVIMVITFFCFTYSGLIVDRIGQSGSIVINKFMSFIVFTIGIQMTIAGLKAQFPSLLQ